jgi:hypothetical protein
MFQTAGKAFSAFVLVFSLATAAGAASLLAANHFYKVAKPDGLTILSFHGSIVSQLKEVLK